MRRLVNTLIAIPLTLGIQYGVANPNPKRPKLIPVTAEMADSLKKKVPGIAELDIREDSSYSAMFYSPNGGDNKNGFCTAHSLQALCENLKKKIPTQEVNGKNVFSIVYRQLPKSPDTLTTTEILDFIECLGVPGDSAYYFKAPTSKDYFF